MGAWGRRLEIRVGLAKEAGYVLDTKKAPDISPEPVSYPIQRPKLIFRILFRVILLVIILYMYLSFCLCYGMGHAFPFQAAGVLFHVLVLCCHSLLVMGGFSKPDMAEILIHLVFGSLFFAHIRAEVFHLLFFSFCLGHGAESERLGCYYAEGLFHGIKFKFEDAKEH